MGQNGAAVRTRYTPRVFMVFLLCVAAGSLPAAGQVVMQLAVASPCGIAVDGAYIYWTEGCTSEDMPPNGQIYRLEIEGAMAGVAEPVLIQNGLDHPAKLTFHGGYIYWTEWGSGPYWLRRAPAVSGMITNISASPWHSVNHSPPVSYGLFVYWNDDHDIWKIEHDNLIITTKVPINLTEHPPDPAYDIYSYAVDGTHIYYTRWNAGFVEKREIKSSSAATPPPHLLYWTFFAIDEHPGPIAVDGSYVYWAEHHGATGGEIKRTLKTAFLFGEQTICTGVPNIESIAVWGNDVYWIGDGWLCKHPKDGTGSITKITDAFGEIRIMDGAVFWGDPYKGIFVYK